MTDNSITNTGITVRESVRDGVNPTRKAHNLTWNDMLEVADTALQTGAVTVGPYAPEADGTELAEIHRGLNTLLETTHETHAMVDALGDGLADALADALDDVDIETDGGEGLAEADVRTIAERAAENVVDDHAGGGW